MPRLRDKKKSIKYDGVPVTPEAAKKQERNQALKNLKKAKKLEADRLKNGYRYIQQGKTRRLIKTN